MATSLTSMPPGTEEKKDVVSCKVYIGGIVLNNEIMPLQVSVNKTFNKISSARLVFRDGSASDRDFVLSNDIRFKPGNDIRIELGYHGETETVFEGIIIRHAVKVLQKSGSVLSIEAKDKAIKLTAGRKSVYFTGQKDSQVMETILDDFDATVEPTSTTHAQLVQFEATDWDFVVTRAEANGMLVLTDDGSIVISKPSLATPSAFTVTYGYNMFEFEADMDARRQIKTVAGQSWDYAKQEMLKSEEGFLLFDETGDLSSDELGDILAGTARLSHTGNLEQEQLQSWADAYSMRNKLSKAIGRVRVEGIATIKPGSVITLAGVGDHFNGDVFVSGVLHQFDGSWLTDIQFGWKDEWFFQHENITDKPASGLLPAVNGLQIGKVMDISGNATDDQFRVKVYTATIDSVAQGIWARVASLDAGKDHGIFFRPQKDDEVILGFLNDDPRDPIILGYLHSKDKNKSPLPINANSVEYGIVTKEKQQLIFDDTNKKITLCATASAGPKTIVLNDGGAIEIKDEISNSIKMDASGITIQAAPGKNVVIKGTFVNIN